MATLDPNDYDFVDRFPVPNDEERHRAGRQGVLDQKEDAAVSDGDWIAFQHSCWAHELRGHHETLRYLRWAVARGVDPHSGRPPRDPQRWPALRDQAARAIQGTQSTLEALLSDYADYFGQQAADRFGGFVMRGIEPDAGLPAQADLF